MTDNVEELWSVDTLPYFVGFQDKPQHEQLPQKLPFRLGFDLNTSLIVQVYDPEIERYNNLAYELGGWISSPPGEGTFGEILADDILNALLHASGKTVKGLRFLEIGCATGYLLDRLANMDATVVGCEPGLQALTAREKYHLEIVQDMFKPELFPEPFDCVYSHGVLEHIVNPEAFIHDITQVLKAGGLAFFGIPDCLKDLESGNPNMLLHEHWTYPTPESAVLLLQSCGFTEVGSQLAEYGDMMYIWGRRPEQKRGKDLLPESKGKSQDLRTEALLYVQKLNSNIKKCQERIDKAYSGDKTIGLYGASNAMNFLGLLNWPHQPRIFDTDTMKHGFYVPCGANPIESPDALLTNPVHQLWVLPLNFYKEIGTYLKNELKIPESIEVLSFYDIIND